MMIFGSVVSAASPDEMIAPEMDAVAPIEPRRRSMASRWAKIGWATAAARDFKDCALELPGADGWTRSQKWILNFAPGILMNWDDLSSTTEETSPRRRFGFNYGNWEDHIAGPSVGPTCEDGYMNWMVACIDAAGARLNDNAAQIEEAFNANFFMSRHFADNFNELFGCATDGIENICQSYYDDIACPE